MSLLSPYRLTTFSSLAAPATRADRVITARMVRRRRGILEWERVRWVSGSGLPRCRFIFFVVRPFREAAQRGCEPRPAHVRPPLRVLVKRIEGDIGWAWGSMCAGRTCGGRSGDRRRKRRVRRGGGPFLPSTPFFSLLCAPRACVPLSALPRTHPHTAHAGAPVLCLSPRAQATRARLTLSLPHTHTSRNGVAPVGGARCLPPAHLPAQRRRGGRGPGPGVPGRAPPVRPDQPQRGMDEPGARGEGRGIHTATRHTRPPPRKDGPRHRAPAAHTKGAVPPPPPPISPPRPTHAPARTDRRMGLPVRHPAADLAGRLRGPRGRAWARLDARPPRARGRLFLLAALGEGIARPRGPGQVRCAHLLGTGKQGERGPR